MRWKRSRTIAVVGAVTAIAIVGASGALATTTKLPTGATRAPSVSRFEGFTDNQIYRGMLFGRGEAAKSLGSGLQSPDTILGVDTDKFVERAAAAAVARDPETVSSFAEAVRHGDRVGIRDAFEAAFDDLRPTTAASAQSTDTALFVWTNFVSSGGDDTYKYVADFVAVYRIIAAVLYLIPSLDLWPKQAMGSEGDIVLDRYVDRIARQA